MSYAVSTDASGTAFVNSRGEPYALPVTESSAETICEIPQGSALINQTSMTTDGSDYPYIISYWRVDGVVQYNILRIRENAGSSTIRITLDRVFRTVGRRHETAAVRQAADPGQRLRRRCGDSRVLPRRREGFPGVSGQTCRTGRRNHHGKNDRPHRDAMGEWEPSVDPVLWKETGTVQVFVQYEHYRPDGTEQGREAEYVWIADVTSFLAD